MTVTQAQVDEMLDIANTFFACVSDLNVAIALLEDKTPPSNDFLTAELKRMNERKNAVKGAYYKLTRFLCSLEVNDEPF